MLSSHSMSSFTVHIPLPNALFNNPLDKSLLYDFGIANK